MVSLVYLSIVTLTELLQHHEVIFRILIAANDVFHYRWLLDYLGSLHVLRP